MSQSVICADRTLSIYGLIDPRTGECRYVGKAVNPQRRLRDHLWAISGKSHKNSWLKNLLAAGLVPELTIIDSGVALEDANTAEQFWISLYRGWGCPLTNGTDGGDGGAITDPEVLTWEKVDEIRQLSAQGVGNRVLAEQFGVTGQNIWNVVTGRTWKLSSKTRES